MTNSVDKPQYEAPSARQLARASAAAILGAGVIFVVAVLPAEYGIDPLGTGHVLGIAKMSEPPAAPPPVETAAVTALEQTGPLTQYPSAISQDTVTFTLDAFDFVEYKYVMPQGAGMTFSWKASAVVEHDFHGEPDTDPEGGLQSYDKSNKQEASGSLVAPFTGVHGWYWHNQSADPVTVTMTSAGFYTSAIEFKSDRTKHPRGTTPVALTPAPAP